jgi:hypothetical protein
MILLDTKTFGAVQAAREAFEHGHKSPTQALAVDAITGLLAHIVDQNEEKELLENDYKHLATEYDTLLKNFEHYIKTFEA